MDFRNLSDIQAELISGTTGEREDLIVVQVVAKALGRWNDDGEFSIAADEDTPVVRAPLETPWGVIPSDIGLRKQGCDVVALGRAHSPHPQGTSMMPVQVAVDDDIRRMLVFGDRRWEQRNGKIVPTPPESFVALDLTWDKSYGGQCIDDHGNDVVYAYHPHGQGYQVSKSCAQDELLPNIEDPAELISQWSDTPRPCNIGPIPTSVQMAAYGRTDQLAQPLLTGRQLKLPADFGNIAHPNFRFDHLQPGQLVQLAGMTIGDPLRMLVPNVKLFASAEAGDRKRDFELALETLLFLPEVRSCIFTWRTQFAVRFLPRERRQVTLRTLAA